MEDNGQLQVGNVVQMSDDLYRILAINSKFGIFVQLGINKLNIMRLSLEFVKYQISIGGIKKADWKEEEFLMKDLTEQEKEESNRKVIAIERMLQQLYPAWERISSKETKPEVKKLVQELGYCNATTYKLIRLYLQSGRDRYALVDKRKGEKNRNNDIVNIS